MEDNIGIVFAVAFALIEIILPRVVIGAKVDNIFSQKRNCLYLMIIRQVFFSIYASLEGVGIIIFYFFIFFVKLKNDKKISLFYSLYLYLIYDSLHFFFGSIVARVFDLKNMHIFFSQFIGVLLALFCLLIVVIILDFVKLDKELLKSKGFSYYVTRAIYIFLFLSIIRISSLVLVQLQNPFIHEYDLVISLFVFMVYLLTILYLKERQTRYLENENLKEKENENLSLNHVITELSSLYDEIRGFRHDFGGIVSSLEPAIKEKNIDEVESIYQNVLIKMNKGLQKSDYSVFNANRIKDIAIKNVLMQKMIQAKNEKIPFKLEISGDIPKVFVPMLDTIRILNILCDNAIEGAIKADEPKVNIALSSNKGMTYVIIENTREEKYIDQNKIWEKGYSTKGSNRGIGLYTISNIMAKYEGIEIITMISNNTFTQKLKFKNKGDRS